ncbi:MAG: hypothetical protein V1929_13625 [bacterium]
MTKRKKTVLGVGLAVAACATIAGVTSFRTYRIYKTATDIRSQVRYLIENGTTIGEAPAAQTFSLQYLEGIFGDNPDLLDQLKSVVSQGLADDPSLNLGEVAAMVVTYRKGEDGKVDDVVVHVAGGFPLGRRKPGFHRDGYLRAQIDESLWEAGSTLVSFVGRDLIVFANDDTLRSQEEILEGIYSGNIMPLVESLHRPLYYTAVFPDPQRVVPPQLRHHVQACIIKGHMGMNEGSIETILLTPSPRSAAYALTLLHDLRIASLIVFRARWSGIVADTPWGPTVGSWWAYELANTVESMTMEKEQNIVRMKSKYERVMVNVTLKCLERFGRDLAQMRGSLEERLDPRLVDARMKTRKPLHYWSEEHKWGPDWPIRDTTNIVPVKASADEPAESGAPQNPVPPVSQSL